jgi:hypothetical protein
MALIYGRVVEATPGIDGRIVVEGHVTGEESLALRPGHPVTVYMAEHFPPAPPAPPAAPVADTNA